MTKYSNKKTLVDGIWFDSKKEAARYQDLKLLQAAKVISDLKVQQVFELAPSIIINGRKRPPLIVLVLLVVLSVSGCANQPAFCPEVRVNFCPAR